MKVYKEMNRKGKIEKVQKVQGNDLFIKLECGTKLQLRDRGGCLDISIYGAPHTLVVNPENPKRIRIREQIF